MICSLLELQADAIESPEGKAALEYSSNRIYAIARLYEQLYRAMSSGQVNLCDYLRGLAEAFQETSRDTSSAAITLKMRDAQISLDVDRAVPCGLIVNELLTNAAKHAFAPGGTGEIGIAVEEMGDRIQLYVWDNGRGLPAGVDVEHSSSLGLRLVAILARRLKAEVKVDSNQGTAFTFTFPSAPES